MEKAREPAATGEGREGDWDCGGCHNRNYAFRSFCNRCKQPRLLVDTKTPADSKWLPRIGDWICTGCSNNNYASREKCKKCGQPKEIAAMPAIAMPGASLPSYAHYFARAHGAPGYNMMSGNSPLTSSPNWTVGGAARYGLHAPGGWPLHGNSTGNFPFPQNVKQVSMVPKGWREGDWLCSCGFHNYSSRAEVPLPVQCKKCNASMPGGGPCSTMSSAPDIVPTLGMKRLASDEFAYDWDNKRLNAGVMNSYFLTNGPQHSFQGFGQIAGSSNSQANEFYSSHSSGGAGTSRHFEVHAQSQQVLMMPTIIGKGAKQWRDGDWMCTNCNNHNFASRSQCNRCKTQKDSSTQPVLVS